MTVTNEVYLDLKAEYTMQLRENRKLNERLLKMQERYAKLHEEIRTLKLQNGARNVGPYKK